MKYELKMISDGATGEFTKAFWIVDDSIIAEQVPEEFSMPVQLGDSKFTLPDLERDHYCKVPDHVRRLFSP